MFTRKLLFSAFNIAARSYPSRIIALQRKPVLLKCSQEWSSRCFEVSAANMSAGDTKYATYEEVKNLKDNASVLLIDVREPSELKETGIIPGSINIPLGELENSLKVSADTFFCKFHRKKPALNTPLVFSCKAGVRSEKALNIALALGFSNARSFKGGWTEWEKHSKMN